MTQKTLTRPDLNRRRTLNAAIADMPYRSSIAYRDDLTFTQDARTLLETSYRLCTTVDDPETLRTELMNVAPEHVETDDFDEIVRRWNDAHLTDEENDVVRAAVAIANSGLVKAEDVDAAARQPQPIGIVVCVLVTIIVCIA